MDIIQRLSARWIAIWLASCLTPQSVSALGRGADPIAIPVVDLRTGQPTEAWKLAGHFPALGVSGVQVAPSWLLASRHAAPRAGSTFTNAFGSSQVAECHVTDEAAYLDRTEPQVTHCSNATPTPDLALCRLTRKITPPAAFKFPTLVEDPVKLAGSRARQTVAGNVGGFLSIGHGLPHTGSARYAWSDLFGLPLDGSPEQDGLSPRIAYRDGGDSGSPVFWFSPGNTGVALTAIATCGGGVGMLQWDAFRRTNATVTAFTMPFLRWVQQKAQDMTGERITIATAAAFHGPVKRTPSWVSPGSMQVTGSTPTSVELRWEAPLEHPADVQRYLISVEQQDGPARRVYVNANQTTVKINDLRPRAVYTVCVRPVGAEGMAPLGASRYSRVGTPSRLSDTFADYGSACKQFPMDPTPTPVVEPELQIAPRDFGAIGFWPAEKVTWTRPRTPAAPAPVAYRIQISVDGSPAQTIELAHTGQQRLQASGSARTIKGQRICATITPIAQPATPGPTSGPVCGVVE